MANRHRGEIECILDGTTYHLCLTLGALAELENAFGVKSLSQLVAELSKGALTSSQMLSIIACGLRGAGHLISTDEVAEMQCEDGAAGYARIVTQLLQATFGVPENATEQLDAA